MECLLGIQCDDFVILAADGSVAFSIMLLKQNENKITKLSDSLAMAVGGESGDTVQFAEYIAKNLQLYKMRMGYELCPQAAATFTRKNLAECLRSRHPYHVDLLLAGYDRVTNTPELYFMDHLASMVKTPFVGHGYGGVFSTSIMDKDYRKDLTIEEAQEILKKCVREIQKRFVINMSAFKVCVIDKDGFRDLPDITVPLVI